MAEYTAVRAVHRTTTAGAQDIIVLTALGSVVEIVNRGAEALFCSVGQWPTSAVPNMTAAGDDTTVVPSGSVRVLTVPQEDVDVVVKLISSAAVPYSVQIGGQ